MRRCVRVRASSSAWPAPCPCHGVVACAASPSNATRPLVNVGATALSKIAHLASSGPLRSYDQRICQQGWQAGSTPKVMVIDWQGGLLTSTKPRACGPHPSNIRSSSSQSQGILHFSCSHLRFSGFTAAMLTTLPCSIGELRSARPNEI